MIAAIEGLIPDRRHSPSGNQAVTTPSNPQIDDSGWRPEDQPAAAEQPVPGQLNPFVNPQPPNRATLPATNLFDVALDAINSANAPYSSKPNGFAQSR